MGVLFLGERWGVFQGSLGEGFSNKNIANLFSSHGAPGFLSVPGTGQRSLRGTGWLVELGRGGGFMFLKLAFGDGME